MLAGLTTCSSVNARFKFDLRLVLLSFSDRPLAVFCLRVIWSSSAAAGAASAVPTEAAAMSGMMRPAVEDRLILGCEAAGGKQWCENIN